MEQPGYRFKTIELDIAIQYGLPSSELLAEHKAAGVKLVVSDIDATLTNSHAGELSPQAKHFADTIEQNDLQLILVTNNNNTDFVYSIAEDLSVPEERVFRPSSVFEHKPTPIMVRRAMHSLDVSPEKTFAVGDGGTDVISFLASGIRKASVCLNSPNAANGYPFRRYVRSAEYKTGKQAVLLGLRIGLITRF